MRRLLAVGAVVMLAALAAIGCGRRGAVRGDETVALRGHLVIIGGGLQRENTAVYERILELAGGRESARVAVLPTASGVPHETGPEMVEDFVRLTGRPDAAFVVPITTDNPEAAADPAMAARILEATAVFFTGGVQERIVSVLRPDGASSPADAAVRTVLARGGVVAGTSAGAAMMSDPMIRWGNSTEALLAGLTCAGEDRAVCLMPGMGCFPFGLTDQHFLRRGRLGRLIVALQDGGVGLGYGIDDNRAMVVDLARGELTFLGDRAALLVDVREATRDGLNRKGVRVTLLGEGDRVDARTGEVTPDPSKTAIVTPLFINLRQPYSREPWGPWVAPNLIERMALDPALGASATDDLIGFHLSRDERTRFFHHADRPESLTAIGVRLDVAALEGAAEAARALHEELQPRP
ncbi:MAG: cyanophycinase [Candidatus Sumerlaeia bacterium]|nr:cyanophycinase [Candidatus Sumerlaeia bacterium]